MRMHIQQLKCTSFLGVLEPRQNYCTPFWMLQVMFMTLTYKQHYYDPHPKPWDGNTFNHICESVHGYEPVPVPVHYETGLLPCPSQPKHSFDFFYFKLVYAISDQFRLVSFQFCVRTVVGIAFSL